MGLSKRMQAVADMLKYGKNVADIGTDHAFVPIYLIKAGLVDKAIAIDVGEGPLSRAKEHVAGCGLEDKIETRLSDGLENVDAMEIDSCIIAGMGGLLTVRILSKGREKLTNVSELVLQPQSDIDQVRRYLYKHGFYIDDEDMVIDGGKYYTIIHAVPGTDTALDRIEMQYGRRLIAKKHPVLIEFLGKEDEKKLTILDNLNTHDTTVCQTMTGVVNWERSIIKEALRRMEALDEA